MIASLQAPTDVLAGSPDDIDLTLRISRRARLHARLASRLRDAGLLDRQPTVVRDQLESALVSAQGRERLARWELDRLAWALADVPSIPLVVLKGCAYMLLGLPNAQGRTFADVDLLVPESSLREVESRLSERGWRPAEISDYDERYYRAWAHELPPMRHVEREVEVDLHHNILMRTARLSPSSVLMLEEVRPVPQSRYFVLAPVDMVLHAMTHLMFGSEMDDALRELVDIDGLLRHFGEHEPGFWSAFWPRAEQLDLARPSYYGLRYASRWLRTPVPDDVLDASKAGAPRAPIRALMDRLVPGALFPPHPDEPGRGIRFARWCLYLRSHWIRMPPLMLARHLAYKSYQRWRGPTPAGRVT
jgi:hypothetical protein